MQRAGSQDQTSPVLRPQEEQDPREAKTGREGNQVASSNVIPEGALGGCKAQQAQAMKLERPNTYWLKLPIWF